MREIVPYNCAADLLRDLDNGGEWWDVLSIANDGYISRGEFQAAAATSVNRVGAALFVRMATWNFGEADAALVHNHLPISVRECCEAAHPALLNASEVETEGAVGSLVIMHGTLRKVGQGLLAQSRLNVPTIVSYSGGDSTACKFVPTPLSKLFSVYELRDAQGEAAETALIATPRNVVLRDSQRVRCGGILQELLPTVEGIVTKQFVMQPLYYSVMRSEA